jgi:hypothetical protein
VISSSASWLVNVFSLLSNRTEVPAALPTRASPLLGSTPFNQSLTTAVTSTVTKEFASVTGTPVASLLPSEGAVASVIVFSDHVLVTRTISIEPDVATVLTHSCSVAFATLLPVVPAGRVDRLNFTKLRSVPVCTTRFAALPKLVLG